MDNNSADTQELRPAYLGIPTFMRRPVTRDVSQADVVVMGIPFDSGATSYRNGARFGPRKIREASLLMWGYNRHFDVSPLEHLIVIDFGDIDVDPTNIDTTLGLIATEVDRAISAGATVIALGGDHSITLPILRSYAAKKGPLALVHIDAHLDTEHGSIEHGTPFRHAAREGLLNTNAWIQIGIRGPGTHPQEINEAKELGAEVLEIDECFEIGIPAVIRRIHERIGNRQVYVSLDIDAVDPAFAPGTGTPEVGGFSSHQMLQLVRGLRGLDFAGFDLVEVNPPYDSSDITSILAANIIFEYLSLLAIKQTSR